MYQTFEVVLRAVPRQSFRARSKWDRAPVTTGTSIVSTWVVELQLNVTFVPGAGTLNAMLSSFCTPSLP